MIFGYKASYGKHLIDEDRTKVIDEYAMRTNIKGMQSFLGDTLFFKSHVENFLDKSANMYKISQKSLTGIAALGLWTTNKSLSD